MLSENELTTFLSEAGIPLAGMVISGFETDVSFVFVRVTRDRDNRQQPTNLLLHDAKRRLSERGSNVEFLLVDNDSQEIESGLRATLRHSFDKEIRNVFLSWEGKKGKIWIEPKYAYEEHVERSIREKIHVYLSQVEIELDSIVRTTGENLPTMLACLSRIRHLAPVTEQLLETDLVSRGFSIPSRDWLRRRLDSMRRNGRIIRLANGSYALTLSSLRALGTIKGRTSPDIKRMLALARRGE